MKFDGTKLSLVILGCFLTLANGVFEHQLPPLPYLQTQLSPYVAAQIMEYHYEKHHAGYVRNLNKAFAELAEGAEEGSIEQQISENDVSENLWNIQLISDEKLQQRVRNFGGGHVNHSFFWKIMIPNGLFKFIEEFPELNSAMNGTFGSHKEFKQQFEAAAMSVFGSGWAWLTVDTTTEELEITTTANQDHPQMFNKDKVPILGIDVWEHAYYLQHFNKRDRYLLAWWMVVNWEQVDTNLKAATSKSSSEHEDLQNENRQT